MTTTLRAIKEHDNIEESGIKLPPFDERLKDGLCLNPEASEFNRRYFIKREPFKSAYKASYVIGAQWIDTAALGRFPLAICPKIENIDFLKMFMQCLENPDEYKSFHRIYRIDFESDPIACDSFESVLSPLIIAHYIHVVLNLLRKELRKDYESDSDNLNKKRGRISISTNLKLNTIRGRNHKIYCKYQEYTSDTVENRIIKKALVFSKSIIQRINSASTKDSVSIINSCLSKMEGVSDSVSLNELKFIRSNAIFKDVKDAVTLAKYILKRYDFNISNVSQTIAKTPPFWIDMPLLFEHYIGGILAKAYPGDILYQKQGNTGYPDFLSISTKAILDTKYKPKLKDEDAEIDIIRQLAGYSRDKMIWRLLGVKENTVIPCIFIYPDEKANENGKEVFSRPLKDYCNPQYQVNGVTEFYRIGIGIPKRIKD
ncbi:MAG: TonB-dependent receptor [Bacteroidales bacterium]|nr:TonB-dependent receptor [Bacteroidales bacterium]